MPQSKLSPLVVRDLSVRYSDQAEPVVNRVSFELSPASLNLIIGPNGSGKTSLLKAMLGLVSASGQLEIGSEQIDLQNHQLGPGFLFGYLPQYHNLDLSLPTTVYELLRLTLSNCHHTKAEQQRFISECLERVGAESLEKRQLGSLSGGQLQRVLLARALVHEPRVLLLDEPEANIDSAGELIIYELLKDLTRSGRVTVLAATHELEVVSKYADQVLCLNKELVCAGTPEKALTSSAFDQLYGTSKTLYGHRHD